MTSDRPQSSARAYLNAFQRALDPDRIYVKGTFPGRTVQHAGSIIRVLSWNIARGHDLERIAGTIAALKPHVVCLQEVDWGNERTAHHDVLEWLAQRLDMLGLYCVEFIELASRHRSRRLAGGGVTGNALLTVFKPIAAFRIELPAVLDWQDGANDPALPRRVRRRLRSEPRLGHRCGVGVEIALGDRKLTICSTHLEDKHGGVRGRWLQFTGAARTMEGRAAHATIIAGDFNTADCRLSRLLTGDDESNSLGKPTSSPEASWWKQVLLPQAGFQDPFNPAVSTFNVPLVFSAKLDWIAVKGGRVLDFGMGPSRPSDHRPIWSDISIGGDSI